MSRPTLTERIEQLGKEMKALWRERAAVERATERARADAATAKAKAVRAGRPGDVSRIDYDLRRTLHRLKVQGMELELAYNQAKYAQRAAEQTLRDARRGRR